MPLRKSRTVNLRVEDRLFDDIEKFAEEKKITFSEAFRTCVKSGIRLAWIKPEEITPEKVQEMVKDMNSKLKDETFLEAIDSMTPAQQKGLKSWLIMREEERAERERHLSV